MFRAQKYKSKLCAQGFEDSNLTLYFSLFAPRESNDMANTALFECRTDPVAIRVFQAPRWIAVMHSKGSAF
jgi:hypothetical protein